MGKLKKKRDKNCPEKGFSGNGVPKIRCGTFQRFLFQGGIPGWQGTDPAGFGIDIPDFPVGFPRNFSQIPGKSGSGGNGGNSGIAASEGEGEAPRREKREEEGREKSPGIPGIFGMSSRSHSEE